ncbi:nitroreductase family protein [uncultured Williamsia sp.]|uniref:nitroreductase family protein n=1 Tax=uncultured Williamsia sp. TaxID=259311 RepID=UPI0026056C0E|nr:nitroreductase family protein [uncultured Williamsia sp.]
MTSVDPGSTDRAVDASDDVWTVLRSASTIRRYRDDPVPTEVLRRCLEAATWAPSGGNQQPWRFVVLESRSVRDIISRSALRSWDEAKQFYGIADPPRDVAPDADARTRAHRAMRDYAETGGDAPVCLLFCVRALPGVGSELLHGGSIFPAVQNFALAARAHGLGTAMSLWHTVFEDELREAVGVPPDWQIAATVTAGWPRGRHREVRRKPLREVTACDSWETPWSGSSGPRT